jgi:riboflavin biosynthesis pyrimidine reductase
LAVRAADAPDATARHYGAAEIVVIPLQEGRLDLSALRGELSQRGLHVVLVEGGGATVSGFLRSGLLDRLQITVAPLIIGDGRPGVRLPARARLSDCLRPACRLHPMGSDVLFDCDLRAGVDGSSPGTGCGSGAAPGQLRG